MNSTANLEKNGEGKIQQGCPLYCENLKYLVKKNLNIEFMTLLPCMKYERVSNSNILRRYGRCPWAPNSWA